MAAGDCVTWPCGSPLDFDKLLVSLFGVDATGCVGLKWIGANQSCVGMLPASECASSMTLQEIIQNAIVEDGNGGYALNVTTLTDLMSCSQDCATYMDFETLLKSLFVQDDNGCFALKLYNLGVTCEDLEDYQNCTASLTLEQVVRTSLWTDACGGSALGFWATTYVYCYESDYECGSQFSLDLIVKMLIKKYTGGQCGAINLNYSAVGAETLTDLAECGKHMTFEDALRAALVWNECGLSLNVFYVGTRGGGL